MREAATTVWESKDILESFGELGNFLKVRTFFLDIQLSNIFPEEDRAVLGVEAHVTVSVKKKNLIK